MAYKRISEMYEGEVFLYNKHWSIVSSKCRNYSACIDIVDLQDFQLRDDKDVYTRTLNQDDERAILFLLLESVCCPSIDDLKDELDITAESALRSFCNPDERIFTL